MHRTQLYFREEEWRALNILSHQLKVSIAELIRRAIQKVYLRGKKKDFKKALREVAGIWADRSDLPPTEGYIRGLRGGKRLRDMG
ncbi:CopG family transcriptional regulator [candidate division KSB1 bacterium]|nr:CopG family transcriptional regulator [candidate division KSB1 bacterium]